MTRDEFQQRYHRYLTKSEQAAKIEAEKVNKEGIRNNDGTTDFAIAVQMDLFGWCLILASAARALPNIFPELQNDLQKDR